MGSSNCRTPRINGTLTLVRALRQFDLRIAAEPAFAYRGPGGVAR